MNIEFGFAPEAPYQDPAWQARLDVLSPPNGKLSWLHLYWEPGFPWEHVGRWMIGQVTPSPSVPDMYRDLLEGPNPANFGMLVDGEWVSLLPGVSRRQWHFYRDTGCLLRPYWVVQGKRGGHKLRLTHTENRIVEMQGGEANPPPPGDLPYATPDERTFRMLAKLDMVRANTFLVDYMENSEVRLKTMERNALEQMRGMLWKDWLEPMCGEWGDQIGFHTRGNEASADPLLDKKVEDTKQEFIYGEGA